ncbi:MULTISPECIES: hypothetical protein [Crateriforma]|nr:MULTISPECIES: hypothetical protein [Crateriforma]
MNQKSVIDWFVIAGAHASLNVLAGPSPLAITLRACPRQNQPRAIVG